MERIIDISHKEKLSHLSSCLTTYPILKHLYENIVLEIYVLNVKYIFIVVLRHVSAGNLRHVEQQNFVFDPFLLSS